PRPAARPQLYPPGNAVRRKCAPGRKISPPSRLCAVSTNRLLPMTRIFTTLALTDSLALLVTFALGCWSKFGGGVRDETTSVYLLHFLFGVFTGIGTLLVHCLIFTYFLGTGRWVREVTLAYDLPDEPLYR